MLPRHGYGAEPSRARSSSLDAGERRRRAETFVSGVLSKEEKNV